MLDHIGIAVRSIEESLPFYTGPMGMQLRGRDTVPYESVNIAMLTSGTLRIELIEATSPDCVIARFIEKHGPGMHHTAMRVPDLNATVAKLVNEGAKLVGVPRRGAGGHLYVFVHPGSAGGVLWEIIQE